MKVKCVSVLLCHWTSGVGLYDMICMTLHYYYYKNKYCDILLYQFSSTCFSPRSSSSCTARLLLTVRVMASSPHSTTGCSLCQLSSEPLSRWPLILSWPVKQKQTTSQFTQENTLCVWVCVCVRRTWGQSCVSLKRKALTATMMSDSEQYLSIHHHIAVRICLWNTDALLNKNKCARKNMQGCFIKVSTDLIVYFCKVDSSEDTFWNTRFVFHFVSFQWGLTFKMIHNVSCNILSASKHSLQHFAKLSQVRFNCL